jgi:hypothetical protein
MLENLLLDRHMRAIARYIGPAITAVVNEKTQLRNQDLGPGLGYFNPEVVFQLRRAHRLPHQFA